MDCQLMTELQIVLCKLQLIETDLHLYFIEQHFTK